MATKILAQVGEIIVINAASAEQDSVLQQHLDILMVLCHRIGKILLAGNRLAQKGHRICFKIIKDGGRFIQDWQIAVDADRT